MYEELVKRLRAHNGWALNETLDEAADAIEELKRDLDFAVRAEAAAVKACTPRWIPVTERLPDAEPGYASERVLVTDGKDVAIVEWFNFEECEPFWGYTGFGKDVTHWMPLPEPPKEET